MAPTAAARDLRLNRCEATRGIEQAWCGAFERLRERFPDAGDDLVVHALREADGHAGRAASALRAACNPQAGTDSIGNQEKTKDKRISRPAASTKIQTKAAPNRGDRHSVGRIQQVRDDSREVEALAREGRRLQRQLDGALAEARAERLRADSMAKTVAAQAAVGAAPVACEEASTAPTSGLTSDASQAQLLEELDAARDEGRRLRQELEGALSNNPSLVVCERESLRRELDAILEERAAVGAAAGFRKVPISYPFDVHSTPPARTRAPSYESAMSFPVAHAAKVFDSGSVLRGSVCTAAHGSRTLEAHVTTARSVEVETFDRAADDVTSWATTEVQPETPTTRSKSPPHGAPSSDSDTDWSRPTDLEQEYLLERERLRRKLAELRSMFASGSSRSELPSRSGTSGRAWL